MTHSKSPPSTAAPKQGYSLTIRTLGLVDYQQSWQAMQHFTNTRHAHTNDELWLLEHPPVFTQGQAGKAEHMVSSGPIPVIHTDRGGQITYHGPGQLVTYLLIELKRCGLNVRSLVTIMETSIVTLLTQHGITSAARREAPGVYVSDGAKIAQLGLRIRRGCSFHGLSLNVDMDLTPFSQIHPCGHRGMSITSMHKQGITPPPPLTLGIALADIITRQLGYTTQHHSNLLPTT